MNNRTFERLEHAEHINAMRKALSDMTPHNAYEH